MASGMRMSRTSTTASTALSCSLSAFSALAMCPGYHCTSRTCAFEGVRVERGSGNEVSGCRRGLERGGGTFVLLRCGECERTGPNGILAAETGVAPNASRPIEAPGRVCAHLLSESGPPVHVRLRHGEELVVGIGVRPPQRARRGREPSRPTRGHNDHRRLPGGRRLRCGAPERARAPSAPRRAPEERRGGCVHPFMAMCS